MRPDIGSEEINELFTASWAESECEAHDWTPVLSRSLTYVCAWQDGRLVGFVNVAWEGAIHAFILDTTIHPNMRIRGIGTQLVKRAAEVARQCGVEWLHVDYEPHLAEFYRRCGFGTTGAGLMRLGKGPNQDTSA